VSLAFVFMFAACGSSGPSKTGNTETIGNSVANSDPATIPPTPLPVPACSLVTRAQVEQLLGAPAAGVESDTDSATKNCEWSAHPAVGGSAPTGGGNTLVLGLIRIANANVGYGSTVVGLTPTILQGVGDKATYSSGVNSSGTNEAVLVADKGTVSMSITAGYGVGVSLPLSIQRQFTALAKTVFEKLHA
jgi:hypothetical protein